MRKVNSLVLASALFFAGCGSLYANPYADVPTNHWTYDSIKLLKANGVLNFIKGDKFDGAKAANRLEIAEVLAKTLAILEEKAKKGETPDATTLKNIEKLAREYADVLNTMSIKYSNLKQDMTNVKEDISTLKKEAEDIKNSGLNQKIQISGDMLVRHSNLSYPYGNHGVKNWATLLRLKFVGNVAKDVKAVARWRMLNGLGTSGTWYGENHNTGVVDSAFLQLNNKLGGDILLGRTFSAVGHSLLINQFVDVVRYTKKHNSLEYQFNSYFKRKNGKDTYPIVSFGVKKETEKYQLYANVYGQKGGNGYNIISRADANNVNNSSRYDLELGAHGNIDKNQHYSYDLSFVATKLKQKYNDGIESINHKGKIGYLALNWDSKEEVKAKVHYYIADKEAHGGLFLGGDRRFAMGPETPLEDLMRLDNLMGVMSHSYLGNSDTRNFTDTKFQIEYKPVNAHKFYYRLAYDLLGEQKNKVNGIDNYNPLGTLSGKAHVLTGEIKYQFTKSLTWKSGYTKFKHKGDAVTVGDGDAGHGKATNRPDVDYNLFWSELYTTF